LIDMSPVSLVATALGVVVVAVAVAVVLVRAALGAAQMAAHRRWRGIHVGLGGIAH
jgi:hypothetical protein